MTNPPYDILFDPVQIGPVTAPNRFYAVPHATGHGWAQPGGATALRAMKAEGGWGTVAMQMTEIAADSDMANHPMEHLWDDKDIPQHAVQVDAIHMHGSLAAIELAHGGMRARNFTTGMPVIGPSNLPILRPEIPVQARAMDLSDIKTFRAAHKQAAQRAITAGYDIIYVYAAHDLSLMSHFLSRRTNHRSDEYGGALENRVRLLREVLEDTVEVAAGKAAVAIRFAVDEPDRSVGLRHDGEGRDVVEMLAEIPDLWDVNIAGWPQDSATARFAEQGYQLHFTDFVKSVTSKPVVGVGRFTSPDLMVSLIKKGALDLIGAARPSIADPFLPAKIRDGRIDEIRECIGCNICVSMDGYGVPIRCTQNPTISEEWRRDWHPEIIPQSDRKQHHLIVGAGPAGLECAWTLLRGGHRVTIADAGDEAGGRLLREARLPGLSSWMRVRDYRLQGLQSHSDASLYLSSPMSEDDIASFGADHVVLATGAEWRDDGVGSTSQTPMIFDDWPVYGPNAIMDGALDDARPGQIVVYDDDHFYMANLLAEKLVMVGHNVHYVTPLSMVATWTDFTLEYDRIIERFNALGVEIHVNTKLMPGGGFFDLLNNRPISIDATDLVMVGARQQVDNMVSPLKASLPKGTLHVAGDCLVPGLIQAAVLSGHQTAREIMKKSSEPVPFKRQHVAPS